MSGVRSSGPDSAGREEKRSGEPQSLTPAPPGHTDVAEGHTPCPGRAALNPPGLPRPRSSPSRSLTRAALSFAPAVLADDGGVRAPHRQPGHGGALHVRQRRWLPVGVDVDAGVAHAGLQVHEGLLGRAGEEEICGMEMIRAQPARGPPQTSFSPQEKDPTGSWRGTVPRGGTPRRRRSLSKASLTDRSLSPPSLRCPEPTQPREGQQHLNVPPDSFLQPRDRLLCSQAGVGSGDGPNHRITECWGLEGTSGGHPAQPPAEAGSPTVGCRGPCPGGA